MNGGLQRSGGAYWQDGDGPFCTFCFQERGELVKLRFKGYGAFERQSSPPVSWAYFCEVHKLDVYLYPGSPRTKVNA